MPTSRVEAFSDGVFAIAITLLILDIRVPDAGEGSLARALLRQWPSFTSYAVSFAVIGIIWVNHHAIFRYVVRVDRVVLFLNLGLLMAVSFLPFPTALFARYLRDSGTNGHVAAFVYGSTMTVLSIVWSALWWYLSHRQDVHRGTIGHEAAHQVARQGFVGPLAYGATLGLAWVSPPLTLAVFAALAVFWMVVYRPESRGAGASEEGSGPE